MRPFLSRLKWPPVAPFQPPHGVMSSLFTDIITFPASNTFIFNMMQCRPPRQGGIFEEQCGELKRRRGSWDTIVKHHISFSDMSTFLHRSKRSKRCSLQLVETPEAVCSPLSAHNIFLHAICYSREPGVVGSALVTKGAMPYPQHDLKTE